jgi:glycine oxidase
VKGQILRLHAREPFVGTNVRALVQGTSIYVVPRADGEVVVGATMEEQGYDATVTAGGVYELLRDARTVLPGITELPLVETNAALRPGSPDNAPIIGRSTSYDGLVVATGHGRNGVLLAPVTADAVADLIVDGVVPDVVAPFGPERFVAVRA